MSDVSAGMESCCSDEEVGECNSGAPGALVLGGGGLLRGALNRDTSLDSFHRMLHSLECILSLRMWVLVWMQVFQ